MNYKTPKQLTHLLDSAINDIENQYRHALINNNEDQAENLIGIIAELSEIRAADFREARRANAAS